MTDRSAQAAVAGALFNLAPQFKAAKLQPPRMLLVNGRSEGMKLLLVLSNTHAMEGREQECEIMDLTNEFGLWQYFELCGLRIGWPVKGAFK